jgi:hypothetical protein
VTRGNSSQAVSRRVQPQARSCGICGGFSCQFSFHQLLHTPGLVQQARQPPDGPAPAYGGGGHMGTSQQPPPPLMQLRACGYVRLRRHSSFQGNIHCCAPRHLFIDFAPHTSARIKTAHIYITEHVKIWFDYLVQSGAPSNRYVWLLWALCLSAMTRNE